MSVFEEVAAAVEGRIGRAERREGPGGRTVRYLAIPAESPGGRRIYRAASVLPEPPASVWIASVGTAVLVLLLVLSLVGSLQRRVAAAARELAAGAREFPDRPLTARALAQELDDLRDLHADLKDMSERVLSGMAQLREAEAHLDAILRQIPEGLLVVGEEGRVTRANEAAARLLGVSEQRLHGVSVLQAILSYTLDQSIRRTLAGERVGAVDVRIPDGPSLRISINPLAQTEPRGVVLLLHDLTELRRTDEMRRDFVANVGHELGTPLASIRALAETLQLRGERRPELYAEYLPQVLAQCERMDRLVKDLLLLAQTESGRLKINPEALVLSEVLVEARSLVTPLAEEAGTTVTVEESDLRITADRFAFGQCLRNLLDNAVRYAPGGRVGVSARSAGGRVIVSVTDDGPGIPPEELPRIFERFYRVDRGRDRARGGSGLGLSIVRHLMEAQGGAVSVESHPGEGATFHLTLPGASDQGSAL